MAYASADVGSGPTIRRRTPAQWYALIMGVVLVVIGVIGFFVNSSFDTGSMAGTEGDDLIVFMVNGWHNVVHVLSGIFLLAVSARRDTAYVGSLAFGVLYAAVAVYGFIDGNDVIGLLRVDTADNWLHVAFALTGILAALASRHEFADTAVDADARRRGGPGAPAHTH